MYFVLAYNPAKIAKQCEHCTKLELNLLFLLYTFLSLGWSMKTKYLLYFQNYKLQFE